MGRPVLRVGQPEISATRSALRTPLTTLLFLLAGLAPILLRAGDVHPGHGPALGRPVLKEEIRRWDTSIGPDGRGLPAGRGTVLAGRALYEAHCAHCHGPNGEGASAEHLVSDGMLTGEWPDKSIGSYWPYATTLFDFLRRSMPMDRPGLLSDDQSYALTAYLLYMNGLLAEDGYLDARTLPQRVMPNRNGFVNCYPDSPLSDDSQNSRLGSSC